MKNKKKIIIKVVVTVVVILVAVAGYIYWPYWMLSDIERRLYSGECLSLGRPLTDQEKCDIAVQALISEFKERNPYISRPYFIENEAEESVNTEQLIKGFVYSSLEEFYAMNPNCYEFKNTYEDEGQTFTIPLKEKISGRLNTFITVTYFFSYDDQNNNRPIFLGRTVGLSNCGKIIERKEILDFFLFGRKFK